jgi:hypothetical protein
MSSPDKQEFDDQVLIRYLLGSLPEAEADRLDELSIADDEFAWRLSAVENDLVDAYARGDLPRETLEPFNAHYFSSPKRLEKVAFARTWRRFEMKSGTAAFREMPASASGSPLGWFRVPRLGLQWGFAGAALVMVFVAGLLLVDNQRLRWQGTAWRDQQAALDHRAQELERALGEQRSVNAGIQKEVERLRESSAAPRALKIIAALLLPPSRGIGEIASISVPQGTDQVRLRLRLESDDFPSYRVALRDPAANLLVWRSPTLRATPDGDAKTVALTLPAGLLKQRNYIVELTGVSAQGTAELITSYAFKAVRE